MLRLRASAGSGKDWLLISMALLAPLTLASTLMGQQPSSAPVAYNGMCDASAAILAGGRVLVLNDEDQEQTLLRLFSIRKGGLPQKTFQLDTSSLALDPDEPEIDLEAAAVLMPIAPLATLAGAFVVRRMRPQVFYSVSYITVGVVAVKLVWDSAVQMF